MLKENQMNELISQLSRIADAMEESNYATDRLSRGEMWDGTLVDAINELAKANDKNHWSRKKSKPMSRRDFFKTLFGKQINK